jgi:methionine-rich copper-binding protein CopC
MRVPRFLSERLLEAVLMLAATAFLAQGPAFAVAALATSSTLSSAWGPLAARTVLILGTIFVVGGVLLAAVVGLSRFKRPPAGAMPRLDSRGAFLAASLLALSAAALAASQELAALWRDIIVMLDRAGLFREMEGAGAGSGYVLAPLMAVLYTPILAGLSAAMLVALPVLLAVALAAASPRFRPLFRGAVICCAVLIGAGFVATDLFERVMRAIAPVLQGDADPIAGSVKDELERVAGVLVRSVRAQALILTGHLAWLPFLPKREPHPAPAPERERSPEASPAGGEIATVSEAQAGPAAVLDPNATTERPWRTPPFPRHQGPRPLPASARFARAVALPVFALLGLLMLGIGVADLSRPRAVLTGSSPAPGATLAAPPRTVSLTFSRDLADESSMTVTRTLAADGAEGVSPFAAGVMRSAAIDPRAPRTLQAVFDSTAGEGLYWVTWRAVGTGWSVARHGSFPFRVGTSIPAYHLGSSSRPSREMDVRGRGRRSILAGGIALLLVALVLAAAREGRSAPARARTFPGSVRSRPDP